MTATAEIKFDDEYYEQCRIHQQWIDALGRGDKEEAKRIYRKIKVSAESLMATKKLFGADYIREEGLNTENADIKYGPGWLDRDDGIPLMDRFDETGGAK